MAKVTRTSEEVLPEDKVTNALIDKTEGECSVEVPYNNYGERGYVDLVISTPPDTLIIEIKSNPQTANSVIRQFKKMKANFIEGTDYDGLSRRKKFYLMFTASEKNIQHLKNNKDMYLSLDSGIFLVDESGEQRRVWYGGDRLNQRIYDLKGVSEEGALICPYCGKEYKMEAYYKKHVQTCFGDK